MEGRAFGHECQKQNTLAEALLRVRNRKVFRPRCCVVGWKDFRTNIIPTCRLHKRGIKMAFVSEKQKGVKNFTCLLPRADCTLNKSLASLVSYALRARGELVTGWRGYIATREKTMYATSGERLGIFTR